jgi:peroxiredoxin
MMKFKRAFLCVVLLSMSLAYGGEQKKAALEKPAPEFSLPDKENETHSLSEYKGKIVVLEWTNLDCPFVKKHYDSGNMQKLQEKYTEKGVVWLSICSSGKGKQGDLGEKELEKRLNKHEPHHDAYLIDSQGKVGKLYGAKTTPHMFIVDSKGNLAYAGAIDDKPSTKKKDIKGANNYVVSALDELLTQKEVSVKATKSYGCSVKY